MARVSDRLSPAARTRLPDLSAAALFVVLAVWISVRYWRGGGRLSLARPADQVWSTWLLAHVAHAVRHLQDPLVGLPVRVPGGSAVLPVMSSLGCTVPLAPFTLWLGPETTYTLWMTVAFAATAMTTYWALSRYVVRSRVAAVLGAMFCAAAPGVLWHANGQLSFVTNFLVPILLVRTVRLAREPKIRAGLVLGLLVAWQFAINAEMLLLTVLGGGVAALFHLILARRARAQGSDRRAQLTAYAVALGTAAVLVALPLWYIATSSVGSRAEVDRPGEDLNTFSTFWRDSLSGYYTAGRGIGSVEQNSWFGWPLLAITVVILLLFWRQRRAVRTVALTGVVFAVLSLGEYVHLSGHRTAVPGPWWPLSKVVPLTFLPATRLALVVAACLGLLLALVCDHLPTPDPVSAGVSFRRLWIIAVIVAVLPVAPRPLQALGSAGSAPEFITSGAWRHYVAKGQTVVPAPSTAEVLDAAVLQSAAMGEFDLPADFLTGPNASGTGSARVATAPTTRLLQATARSGKFQDVTPDAVRAARRDLHDWHAAIIVLSGGANDPLVRKMVLTISILVGFDPQRLGGAYVWDVRELVRSGLTS